MKKILALTLALCMVLALAACGAQTPATETNDGTAAAGALKIGGIGPITGAAAIYGTAVMNGAQIAVDEINAKGGLQVELNFQDDEHDAEKSVNAYNTLADWGAQMICGVVTTTPCIAVAAEANKDHVFMLTPSASSPLVTHLNALIFTGLHFPGKNTRVGCHFLLQEIFPTQESNPRLLHLLHRQMDSLPPNHLRSPFLWMYHSLFTCGTFVLFPVFGN